MGRDERPALSKVEKYQREVDKILGEIALRRGKDAERKVLASIDEANGSKPEWLFGGRKAKREEDARGIDVFVFTDEGEIPLQVKSSENSRHNFRKYRKWHGIPCVVVEPHTHREEVFELVLKASRPRERNVSRARSPRAPHKVPSVFPLSEIALCQLSMYNLNPAYRAGVEH